MSTCTIVGISGASGSGKTLFAHRLLQALAEEMGGVESIGILSEDFYYKDQTHLAMEERVRVNYDHPHSLDHALLVDHLDKLRAGEAVEMPQYDYCLHTRAAHTTRMEAKKLILVEGILLFSDPALRGAMDYLIFVDTPLDICLMRRASRDMMERGRTFESVMTQYEATVRPMYLQFIEPSRAWADIIVPSWKDNSVAIDLLKAKMRDYLQ